MRRARKILAYAALLLLAFTTVAPFVWMFFTSLHPPRHIPAAPVLHRPPRQPRRSRPPRRRVRPANLLAHHPPRVQARPRDPRRLRLHLDLDRLLLAPARDQHPRHAHARSRLVRF